MRSLLLLAALTFGSPVLAATGGHLFSSSGDPIAGARITARRAETPAQRRTRIVNGSERAKLASATTADDGAFSLEGKFTGIVELLVEHEGFAPLLTRVMADEGDLVLQLTPAQMRSGRVTANGKPVAGALVLALDDSGSDIRSARTDERGIYTIPDPHEWCVQIVVLDPDFAPSILTIESASAALDAALVKGAEVSGTVLAPNTRPQPNARVSAGPWREVLSGADGKFMMRGVPADVKTIVAVHETEIATASRGESKDFVMMLSSRERLYGRVQDAEKKPIPGVLVAAWTEPQSGIWREINVAVSGDDGGFSIPFCDGTEYMVYALDRMRLAIQPDSVNLASRRLERALLVVPARKFVRGTVVDDANHPLRGALVQMVTPDMPPFYGSSGEESLAAVLTGADGSFKLDASSMENDEIRLQATRPGFALGLSKPFEVGKAQPRSLTLVLPKGVAIEGVVVDDAGKPVSGAGIALVQDPYGGQALPIDAALAAGGLRPFVKSDAAGHFALRLNPTLHDLGVWKEGYVGSHQSLSNVAERNEPLKIVLSEGVTLSGRVTRAGRAPGVSGQIGVQAVDDWSGSALVGDDGTFVITGLRPGTYQLFYSNARGAQAHREVKAPANDLIIELPEPAELRGRVTDKATGKPLTNYSVRAQSAGETRGHAVDEEETFTLELPPGEAEIQISAEGYLSASTTITLELDKPAELTMALARGRNVTGRVTSEQGGPIAQASVSMQSETYGWSSAETDEYGEFVLKGLPASALKLAVSGKGHLAREVEVTAAETDARVDITLSRGKRATGRVLTSEGAPVEGARVMAFNTASPQEVVSEADGSFVIEGLGAELVSFRAQHEELGEAQVSDANIARPVIIRMSPASGWGSVHGKVKGFADGGWMFGSVSTSEGQQSGQIARDGSYRIERVRAGEVELKATAQSGRAGASTPSVTITVPPNGDVEADLEFRDDVVVRGSVSIDGQPAPGRYVHFSGAGSWHTTTVEGGAYEIRGLEPGLFDVSVAGFGRGDAFQTKLQVRGSMTYDIRIEHAKLEGRVVDAGGAPLAGVKIGAKTDGGTLAETTTNASGAFELNVQRAPLVVTAVKEGFAAIAQRHEPGGAPLLLTMVRTDGLRVRIVNARSGATLDGYVAATDASGMQVGHISEAEADGAFLVPVAPGAYRISVSAGGFATQSVRTIVPHEGELRIPLTPGGALVVHTKATPGDVVKLVMPNGEEYIRCECNGIAEIRLTGASTRIDHIAPGTYTLQVLDERGLVKTTLPVAIAEGGVTEVEVHMAE